MALETLVRKLKKSVFFFFHFHYAASVNIKYLFSVLPQFEQIKEVCLHAGHASVHVNSL